MKLVIFLKSEEIEKKKIWRILDEKCEFDDTFSCSE